MSEKMSKWALLPAEVQAKAVEFHMKAQSDEALKAEFVAETEATFKAADTDGNGLLNKATYSDYVDKVEQNYKARFGGAPEANEEIKGNWFAAMNAITPEVDGVSLAD